MLEFKRAANLVADGFSEMFAAVFLRHAVMPMLYANDRMLRDVGLSRTDVVGCRSGSLRTDPSRLLMARMNTRHSKAAELAEAKRKAAAAVNAAKPCIETKQRSLAS